MAQSCRLAADCGREFDPSDEKFLVAVASTRSITGRAVCAVLIVFVTTIGEFASAQNPNPRTADETALRQAGKDYLAAVSKGDPKAIAEFWTADGTYTDEHGQTQPARELISQSFSGGQVIRQPMEVKGVTLRFLTENVALEEGTCLVLPGATAARSASETKASGGSDVMTGRFCAVWVKQLGNWKLDCLHEWRIDSETGANQNTSNDLVSLDPLVGQWTGKSGTTTMQFTSKWNANKTFLHRDLSETADGRTVMMGTQEIGWDPGSLSIKSWCFNEMAATAKASGIWLATVG